MAAMIVGAGLVMHAAGSALAQPSSAGPTATPTARSMAPMNEDSWILVDLPPDATQLQHGAEIYRLVCSACHAYSGEGLTDAWRATWHPDDQNCWQSKCHAANHPPDGFVLPIAPAVVGRQALAPFQTAADLRAYIQATMPWQDPNSLTEEEGWAVTAYVIKLNRMNPPQLDEQSAVAFRLHPESASPAPSPTAPSTDGSVPATAVLGAAALVVVFIVAVLLVRGKARPSGTD